MNPTYPIPPVWQHMSDGTHVRVYLICLTDLTGYADDEGVTLLVLVCDGGAAGYQTMTSELPTSEAMPERVSRVLDAIFGVLRN